MLTERKRDTVQARQKRTQARVQPGIRLCEKSAGVLAPCPTLPSV